MHDLNKEHHHDWTPTQARVKGIPVIGIGGRWGRARPRSLRPCAYDCGIGTVWPR